VAQLTSRMDRRPGTSTEDVRTIFPYLNQPISLVRLVPLLGTELTSPVTAAVIPDLIVHAKRKPHYMCGNEGLCDIKRTTKRVAGVRRLNTLVSKEFESPS
jgi:hypothetical protein